MSFGDLASGTLRNGVWIVILGQQDAACVNEARLR